TRAWFDQQPVDVMGMVLLYLTAARIFQDERYQELATLSLDWFFGRNALGQVMVNPETGACYDGLTPEGVNGNQGAESQTAYLLAHLAMVRAGLAPS
ncbi:MAG TPA: mannosyltransferase, partial [Armatimonadota bacterium]|nr:mannosyltransferase [Armatimonadota bacterium]